MSEARGTSGVEDWAKDWAELLRRWTRRSR
jgi:hypothetical protein